MYYELCVSIENGEYEFKASLLDGKDVVFITKEGIKENICSLRVSIETLYNFLENKQHHVTSLEEANKKNDLLIEERDNLIKLTKALSNELSETKLKFETLASVINTKMKE